MKIEIDGYDIYNLLFDEYYNDDNPSEPRVIPTASGLKLLKALRKHLGLGDEAK